jgi:DNA-binding MarR family transcriptional regulator/GNAT superfamily N-acetyltransferase
MSEQQVATVRRFSRLYTQRLGILDDGWLGGGYSLPTVRVMFEIATASRATARDIADRLRLDPGYLSRILRALEADGIVAKEPSPDDARRRILTLTKKGRRVFERLDAKQSDDVASMLRALSNGDRAAVVASMQTCVRVLEPARVAPYTLRAPQAGDLGWIVQRHGALYAEEHRFGARFEGTVAAVVADFGTSADPKRERCWIAEREGERAGSIMVTRSKSKTTAKLRLLLVEPTARGGGLGTRLVAEAIAFATRTGYERLHLWTANVLLDARRLYERAGFVMTHEEASDLFTPAKVKEQTWELELGR